MLRANSQTTRLLIKERFNGVLSDTLDHASHNIIEAKMRVFKCHAFHKSSTEITPVSETRLYLIVKRLQKQSYLMYDVVMNIVEELFEDASSWYLYTAAVK